MWRKAQDNDVYEYVYERRRYRKTLIFCVSLWVAILIVRLTAFVIFGDAFVFSAWNLASLGTSGLLIGVIVESVRTLKKSTRIGSVSAHTGSLEILPEAINPDPKAHS